MFKTSDKYARWVNITHALVRGLSGSHAFGILYVSCAYPLMSVWTGKRVPHVHSVIVQPTFCPFLIPGSAHTKIMGKKIITSLR